LGKGVRTDSLGAPLEEGDRITWFPIRMCRRCPLCLAGDLQLCLKRQVAYRMSGAEPPHFFVTMGDYFYLPEGHPLFKIPEELHDDEVVALNCAMARCIRASPRRVCARAITSWSWEPVGSACMQQRSRWGWVQTRSLLSTGNRRA
jgi:threonine dehydrogenase-like Zn-dependent dehydrogenase